MRIRGVVGLSGLYLLTWVGCGHGANGVHTGSGMETGVRSKGGDSATLRIQVLITNGEYAEAEAQIAEAMASGLLVAAQGAWLLERISRLKEKEQVEAESRPRQAQTCETQFPSYPICYELPPEYSFHSSAAALEAMKLRLGVKNLRLHGKALTETGPCPREGSHYNVRQDGNRAGSITCCPCCMDTANGPIQWEKCRVVW